MAGEDAELNEVCEELDCLILHMMSELESLQVKRQTLNSLVEQGWLSLSQSRYAMGNKGVSSLQYGHEMVPLACVSTSSTEDGSCTFRLVRTEFAKQEDKDVPEVEQVENIGPKDQVLRRRKGPTKTDEPVSTEKIPTREDQLTTSEKSDGANEGDGWAAPQDPLKWFGILVPQSLRRAQSSFKEGVMLAGEVAGLQSSIEVTRSQYRALLKKKQQLLAQGN